ncbi:MAG: PAS domain-containing protein [Verrucomicrobiales bacterium]|nr:PAS domain-containing protein [Verrucomicrobiales bacterium]
MSLHTLSLWSRGGIRSLSWALSLALIMVTLAGGLGSRLSVQAAEALSETVPEAHQGTNSIAALKALSEVEARKAHLVRVVGTVNFARPGWFGFYVEGPDAAIYCDSPQPSTWPQPGDVVEVEGFTAMAYRPYIRARSVKTWGKVPLPEGRLVAIRDLDQNEHDARRIRVRGLVKSATIVDGNNRVLLTQDGHELEVFFHGLDLEALQQLLFAEVECQGSLGRMISLDRKSTVRFLSLNYARDLRVLRPSTEVIEGLALTTLSDVVTNTAPQPGRLVRIKGVLNAAIDDNLWVGAEGLGLRVRLKQSSVPAVGDAVEMVGFTVQDGMVRWLNPARKLSSTSAGRQTPRILSQGDLADWRNFGTLGSVTADVAGATRTGQGDLLLLVADDYSFQARLKYPSAGNQVPATGSRIGLTGILYMEIPPGESSPVSRLLVTGPSDIRLIAPPPWPLAKTLSVVTALSIALGLALLLVAGGYFWLRRAHRRALAALAKEGSRLSEAQRIACIGSWEWDVASGANLWSDENYRLFGYEPGQINPCHDRVVAALHPDDRDRVLKAVQASLDADAPYDLECRIVRPTGEVRCLHCRGEVVRNAAGRPVTMHGTAFDITDRKRVERRDQLQAKALELLAKGSELSVVLGQVIDVVEGDHESWRCCVMVADAPGRRLSCIASGQLPPFFRDALQGLEISLTAGICGQAAARKEPVLASDIEKHPHCEPYVALFLRAGLRGCWAYPILSSTGCVLGTFSVFHRTSVSPTAAELQDLAHTANLASIAIEYRRNEEAQRESKRLLQEAQAIAHVGSFYWNAQTDKVSWSRELFRIFGRDPDRFEPTFETYASSIHEEDRAMVLASIRASMADQQPFCHEYRVLLPNGEQRSMQARGRAVVDSGGTVIGLEGTCQDITERKLLESQVRHIQKMEAIGTLAGGIAHDFNNLLSSILGNTYLAQLDLDRNHPAREAIAAIEQAGNRAKALVKQILSFSRQQDPQREVVELGSIVAEVSSMLRATLPASVELTQVISPDAPRVLADATQIHQVLLNLCTNAWHALDRDRGRIEIRLQNLIVPARETQSEGQLRPGRYACLSVTDTGHGMDAATMERIFDPFFTTKGPGKGTGLGLAVVHGIVESHDGIIRVSSQPQRGTTFHIYLPAVELLPDQAARNIPGVVQGRGERVLFVDDEASLAEIATRMLRHLGYQAETHTRQADALKALRQNPDSYDLVITDLNMPGTSGLEFADAVWKVRPGIPIVLSSGHITEELMQRARGVGIRQVLHKPASIQELSDCMAQLLSQQKA